VRPTRSCEQLCGARGRVASRRLERPPSLVSPAPRSAVGIRRRRRGIFSASGGARLNPGVRLMAVSCR
jgi:hypothetical protein